MYSLIYDCDNIIQVPSWLVIMEVIEICLCLPAQVYLCPPVQVHLCLPAQVCLCLPAQVCLYPSDPSVSLSAGPSVPPSTGPSVPLSTGRSVIYIIYMFGRTYVILYFDLRVFLCSLSVQPRPKLY